jgi:hypothetical protein
MGVGQWKIGRGENLEEAAANKSIEHPGVAAEWAIARMQMEYWMYR